MAESEHDEGASGGLPDFLRDPLGMLRRRWRWMLGVVLLLGGGAAAAVFTLVKPSYVATARVLVSSQQISEDFVRPTVQESTFEKLNAVIGATLARDQLRELVEEHDLYPRLREKKVMSEVVARMRSNVTIEEDSSRRPQSRYEQARVFAISFRADRPERAAAVANELADRFITENIRFRTQQARLTTKFLRRELEQAEKALREQNRKITEFKEEAAGELPGELETNLRRLERLQERSRSLALQVAEAESRLAQLAAGTGTPEVDPSSPRARLESLRARLAEQRSIHTDEHPNVVALERQVRSLEQAIAEGGAPLESTDNSREALMSAARRRIEALRAQQEDVQSQIDELDTQVARTPERQEKLDALEEKASVLRENYLEFLRKVKDAELSESLESAQQGQRVSVIDAAVPPTSPEQSKPKYLVAGLVAALGLALGVGLLLELLDPVLLDGTQVERDFDLPVLGSVTRIG